MLLASLHHHKPPRRGDTSGEKVRNQSRNADATRYGKSKTHLSHQKAIPRCNTGMRRRREAYRARDSICRAHRGRRERNVQSRLQTWPKGIVSKKLAALYRSGPSKTWLRSKIRKLRRLYGLSTGLSEGAISVAIGGKADIRLCTANVRF